MLRVDDSRMDYPCSFCERRVESRRSTGPAGFGLASGGSDGDTLKRGHLTRGNPFGVHALACLRLDSTPDPPQERSSRERAGGSFA
jgi:hypothetical protein